MLSATKLERILLFLLPVLIVIQAAAIGNALAGPPSGSWILEWHDEFSGMTESPPADHWFSFDVWGDPEYKWRDAYYTEKDAYLKGKGQLVLRARLENDKLKGQR